MRRVQLWVVRGALHHLRRTGRIRRVLLPGVRDSGERRTQGAGPLAMPRHGHRPLTPDSSATTRRTPAGSATVRCGAGGTRWLARPDSVLRRRRRVPKDHQHRELADGLILRAQEVRFQEAVAGMREVGERRGRMSGRWTIVGEAGGQVSPSYRRPAGRARHRHRTKTQTRREAGGRGLPGAAEAAVSGPTAPLLPATPVPPLLHRPPPRRSTQEQKGDRGTARLGVSSTGVTRWSPP